MSGLKKILIAALVLSTQGLSVWAADQKFDEFWTKFKSAVEKNDKQAIADMTKFPYMMQYNKYVNKEKFVKECGTIFDAKTRKALLKSKPVKDKDCYMVFVGEEIFCFNKVGDRYLFTEIGVND